VSKDKPKFNNIRDALRCACKLDKNIYRGFEIKNGKKFWYYFVDD